MSVGASLRSLEIRAAGVITEENGILTLRMSTDESVILKPLTEKVQWNHEKKIAHPPTRAESAAFTRLKANLKNLQIEVTGPYRVVNMKQRILEVREYNWLSR